MKEKEVKIEVYLPISFVGPMREGLNKIGACKVGNYDHCISITQVSGFWRPLPGAQPYDGVVGELSQGQECKIEVRCKEALIQNAIQVIEQIHPYEEPLFNIIPLLNHLYE